MKLQLGIAPKIVKPLVFLIAYTFLAYQLVLFDHWEFFFRIIGSISIDRFVWLGLCLSLLPVNWLLEAWGWRFLLRDYQPITLKGAFQSIFYGLLGGLISPAKIGEWPGRAVPFNKEQRGIITALSILNSLIKSLAITTMGVISWELYLEFAIEPNPILFHRTLIIAGVIISVLGTGLFLFSRQFMEFLLRLVSKARQSCDLVWITVPYRITAFGLSLLRTIIFSLQFIFLARFFLGEDFSGALLLIPPIYFFFITFIPAFTFADPAIRGSVALILFQGAENTAPVFAVLGIGLWIINTVIPMLLGALVFGLKTSKP